MPTVTEVFPTPPFSEWSAIRGSLLSSAIASSLPVG
jgi:hypothetical protein